MCTDGTIDRYVDFYTDFAFKKLFGTEMNKELLISFLNALLHGRERIEDVTYLNAEHLGTQEYDRRAVFDVYCRNDRGEMFIVEMQKGEQQFFKDRSIYYSTFAIREQAPRGHWNYELKGVYTIGILNFELANDFGGSDDYYHEVKLMNTATREVFYDKLTFIYIEMPKFTKTEAELETLFDRWLYAIRHLSSLQNRPAALRDRIFERLFERAEIAKFDKRERYEYEDSLKVLRDWGSVIETAELRGETRGREEGLQEGLEKGLQEGLEKGLQQGLEAGKLQAQRETALALKRQGVATEVIAQATGLSIEDITTLSTNQ